MQNVHVGERTIVRIVMFAVLMATLLAFGLVRFDLAPVVR